MALDEALFEHGHLIADLASVDGVVVLNKFNDLLGFGGMISGLLPDVRTMWRAHDLDHRDAIEEASARGIGLPIGSRPLRQARCSSSCHKTAASASWCRTTAV